MTGHALIGWCLAVTILWAYPACAIADRIAAWWHRPPRRAGDPHREAPMSECESIENTMVGPQRCLLPGGHAGNHSYLMGWTDERWAAVREQRDAVTPGGRDLSRREWVWVVGAAVVLAAIAAAVAVAL